MKVELVIKYNWDGEIKEHHKSLLCEDAEERIFYMISKGFTSGELNTNVYTEHDKSDKNYHGWWSVSCEVS